MREAPSIPGPGPRTWLLVVVGLSIAVRLVYFAEAKSGPLLAMNRWDQSDMAFFDEWARVIAAGDWLTDRSLHPQHHWHRDIARAYFGAHPDALLALSAGRTLSPEQASAELWDRWYAGKTFHQEPLYPYLVALTYRLFGADPRFVFVWQLAAGVAANVLVYLVTLRLFPPPVPALAGVLAVLSAPLLFYEMVLLRESLIVAAGLALVWLVLRAADRGDAAAFGALGLGGGLALLLKSSFALFLLPALVVLAARPRPSWAATARLVAVFGAGLALGMAPLVGRNLAVGLPPLSASSVGPITFVNANTEDYPPEAGFFVSLKHAPEIMGASDGRFLPAARGALATHPGVGSWLRQAFGKLQVAWHWYEVPDNCSFYLYRLHAGILGLPVTFTLLGPMALVGFFLAVPSVRAWPLLLLVASSLLTMLVFYASSRFRAPLAAAAIPLAALALVKTAGFFAARRLAAGGLALAAMLGAFAWTSRPLAEGRPLLRAVDCRLPFVLFYGPRMESAQARGDWAGIAAVMQEALRGEPDFVTSADASHPPSTEDAFQCVSVFATAHANAAFALKQSGLGDRAARHEQEAARLEGALAEAQRRTRR